MENKNMEMSAKTIRVYESAYRNNKELFEKDLVKTASNIVNSDNTPSYKKTLLKAYIWKNAVKPNDKSKICNVWKELNDKENKKYLDNTNNKNVPNWGSIKYRYHKYVRTSNDALKDRNAILAGFYVYMPPRRREYAKIRYYTDHLKKGNTRDDENYYVSSTGELVLNNYKTSKVYGSYKVKLHSLLKKKISEYVIKNRIVNKDYLFDMTDTQLYNIIHQVFGNDISVDILRRSYITNFYKGGTPESSKIETLSKQMGHDVKTQLRYRTLNVKCDNDIVNDNSDIISDNNVIVDKEDRNNAKTVKNKKIYVYKSVL
jgi:hypothetical protein